MDDFLEKAVQEIAKNHRKIIDDWCKAYMAQLYEEGHNLKPGCFTLNEQRDMVLSNGGMGSIESENKDFTHSTDSCRYLQG